MWQAEPLLSFLEYRPPIVLLWGQEHVAAGLQDTAHPVPMALLAAWSVPQRSLSAFPSDQSLIRKWKTGDSVGKPDFCWSTPPHLLHPHEASHSEQPASGLWQLRNRESKLWPVRSIFQEAKIQCNGSVCQLTRNVGHLQGPQRQEGLGVSTWQRYRPRPMAPASSKNQNEAGSSSLLFPTHIEENLAWAKWR